MFTNKNYILASSSKSRFKILKNCGLKFKQISPTCNEEEIKKRINKKYTPSEIAKILSYEKAKSVSQNTRYKKEIIIGCDTLIYYNGKIYDKAKNFHQAKKKLIELSGKKHTIVSGLTICKGGKKIWQCSETSTVQIRNIKSAEIEKYLKLTGTQVLNSVGCYQLEALGPQIIENIKGDYFNVLGLPLFRLLSYFSKNKNI